MKREDAASASLLRAVELSPGGKHPTDRRRVTECLARYLRTRTHPGPNAWRVILAGIGRNGGKPDHRRPNCRGGPAVGCGGPNRGSRLRTLPAGPLCESAGLKWRACGVDGPFLLLSAPRTQSAPDLRGASRSKSSCWSMRCAWFLPTECLALYPLLIGVEN